FSFSGRFSRTSATPSATSTCMRSDMAGGLGLRAGGGSQRRRGSELFLRVRSGGYGGLGFVGLRSSGGFSRPRVGRGAGGGWRGGGVDPPLRRPLADVIGVNTHYGTDVDPGLDRFAAAGLRLVRNDLTWSQIERVPGQYDFSGPDRVVAALEQRGIHIIFILDYGNSLYGPSRAVVDDAGREAFAAFAAAAARRYGGRGHLCGICDAPNI